MSNYGYHHKQKQTDRNNPVEQEKSNGEKHQLKMNVIWGDIAWALLNWTFPKV